MAEYGTRDRHMTLRISAAELAEIDRRAKHLDMSRNDYLIRAACGELPDQEHRFIDRVNDHEQRLAALERMIQLGAVA